MKTIVNMKGTGIFNILKSFLTGKSGNALGTDNTMSACPQYRNATTNRCLEEAVKFYLNSSFVYPPLVFQECGLRQAFN